MHRTAAFMRLTPLALLIFANSIFCIAQDDPLYRLPAGTRMTITLVVELNSAVASVDDTFLATVAKPVKIRDIVVLPAGTVVEGKVTAVERADSFGRNGSIEIVFYRMKILNEYRDIDGVMLDRIAAPSGSRAMSVLSILGGAAAGTAIGAASSDDGALLGGVIGTGVGTAIAFFKKGKEARLEKDHEFEIEIRKEVVLPVLDY